MPADRVSLPKGALIATFVSGAMIAQQVAGKAARDALFLSSFSVTVLPWMMVSSAVLSLVAVLWLSRMIVTHSPAVVVPISFALSGAGLFGAWALSFPFPRLAAVTVYLQTALFGAAVISAFWSLMNEKFDAHTGKRAVTYVTAGGTLGGVLGGVLAWRAAQFVAVPTMLPLLGIVNLLCFAGCLVLRGRRSGGHGATSAPTTITKEAERTNTEPKDDGHLAPFRVLTGAPYLQNLAAVVALGAVTSGLLDYAFSAEAVLRYSKGPELLSFFSLFWLIVGVLSFALQMLFGKLALEKLGLAITIALLPGVVILGGAFGLAVPGLLSTSILRGGEATQRNSLFRAAYELLYTPLSEKKKRSTKTLIDVGFDRLGTVVAGGIVVLAVHLNAARANGILLSAAVICALLTVTRSSPLHRGYVKVLEESLHQEAKDLAPRTAADSRSPHEKAELRDAIVEHMKETRMRQSATVLAAAAPRLDASLPRITDLCSQDPERVRKALAAPTPLEAPVVAFAILLLGQREFHRDALHALRPGAAKIIGQLVDAMCDPGVPSDIRRRIPRVLAECPTTAAAEALIRGTGDERFEVRYECGRALLRITTSNPDIVIPLETVVAIVKREVSLSEEVWKSQPATELDDAEETEPPTLVGRLLRDRIDRSLEHVFTLLALNLDRESIRVAFKALHQTDAHLRGTALEYLETVLPDDIRDAVWPFLREERPMRPQRPADEILADLVAHKNPEPPQGGAPGNDSPRLSAFAASRK